MVALFIFFCAQTLAWPHGFRPTNGNMCLELVPIIMGCRWRSSGPAPVARKSSGIFTVVDQIQISISQTFTQVIYLSLEFVGVILSKLNTPPSPLLLFNFYRLAARVTSCRLLFTTNPHHRCPPEYILSCIPFNINALPHLLEHVDLPHTVPNLRCRGNYH